MLRTVFLSFTLLAVLVLAAVATGVRFVSNYVRDHAYTIVELETAHHELDATDVQFLTGDIEMGAGQLTIGGFDFDASSDAAATIDISDNVLEIVTAIDYQVSDDVGRFRLWQDATFRIPDPRQLEGSVNRWSVQLSPTIPISLGVEMGTGQLNLNLAGLMLTDLSVEMGTGESVIDLRGIPAHSLRASIEQGVGSSVLYLPSEVGVRLTAQAGIGSVDAESMIYRADEDDYINSAYREGEPVIQLDVMTGIGSVEVMSGEEE